MRSRSLVLILLLAVGSLQSLAQNWDPRGKIQSVEFQVERRNGNVVEGTEFVRYEYRVFTSLTPTDETHKQKHTVHHNRCRGNKHPAHVNCDRSCDDVDNHTESIKMKGIANKLRDAMDEMERQSARMSRSLGMPGGPNNWSSAASSFIRDTINECRRREVTAESRPIDDPCGFCYREFGRKKTNLSVRGEFWKVGFYRSRGVNTPIEEMVASHDGVVVHLWYPQATPIYEERRTYCACKPRPAGQPVVAEDIRVTIGEPRTTPQDDIGPEHDGCHFLDENGKAIMPGKNEIEVIGIGESLGKAKLRVINRTGRKVICKLPPGTEMVPEDSGTQVMSTTKPATFECPAMAATVLYVSIEPQVQGGTDFDLSVACTEIDKKEPTPATRFKLRQSRDPFLGAILAQPPMTSMFASTITQGQVWLYKDKASRERINKIMIPGLTESMYVNALFGVSRVGVDLREGAFRALLDPKLLPAAGVTKDAAYWFADTLAEADESGKHGSAAVAALKTAFEKGERIDGQHAARIATVWAESGDATYQALAVQLIESVPEKMRRDFLLDGGSLAVKRLLVGDEKAALRLLDTLATWSLAETVEGIGGASVFAQSEPVRTKAGALLKSLGASKAAQG